MKKILILAGTHFHIPVIRYAKSRGHHVITCDYLPDNPGHALADEYHNVSTTDRDAVLQLARDRQIDGILCFASDPAAPTAAWVAEQMGLPGSPYASVRILSEKDLFRKFLWDNGFACPTFRSFTSADELRAAYQLDAAPTAASSQQQAPSAESSDQLATIKKSESNKQSASSEQTASPGLPGFPLMVKPVDSSGSKGVARVDDPADLPALFDEAMRHSRCKRVIVEECIDGHQFHGDGFVYDGRLVFTCLGDHLTIGKLNCSTIYPSGYSAEVIRTIEQEVDRLIRLSGFRQGGINIEARLSDADGKCYIIEVGPRNGGNFTPDIIGHATGFDFVRHAVDISLGEPFEPYESTESVESNEPTKPVPSRRPDAFYASLVLYARRPGRFRGIRLSPELEPLILEQINYKKPDEEILSGANSSTAAGALLLRFGSQEQMKRIGSRAHEYYEVLLEDAADASHNGSARGTTEQAGSAGQDGSTGQAGNAGQTGNTAEARSAADGGHPTASTKRHKTETENP